MLPLGLRTPGSDLAPPPQPPGRISDTARVTSPGKTNRLALCTLGTRNRFLAAPGCIRHSTDPRPDPGPEPPPKTGGRTLRGSGVSNRRHPPKRRRPLQRRCRKLERLSNPPVSVPGRKGTASQVEAWPGRSGSVSISPGQSRGTVGSSRLLLAICARSKDSTMSIEPRRLSHPRRGDEPAQPEAPPRHDLPPESRS